MVLTIQRELKILAGPLILYQNSYKQDLEN